MKSHYLFPGKFAAFSEETVISTLLGSCVAVALFDPIKKIGGLNHYLLPEAGGNERENSRYGKDAIRMLLDECTRLGADPRRMQAKIYGGANVISVASLGDGIGKRNIELAENTLRELSIPILERNVGGERARTIKVNSANFEVLHNSHKDSPTSDQPVDVSGFRPLQTAKAVKVLVIDDSATVRTLFSKIFTSNGLQVVGTAADAYQARDMIVQLKPDVLTLDIEMPKMSGVMFLEKIMKHLPLPVVMVSSLSSTGDAALKALELGAVEFVHKPSQFDPAVLRDLAEVLVGKVRAAATVNVLKKLKESPAPVASVASATAPRKKSSELKVVTIGGNSGSSDDLAKILSGLAADTPPVVVSCSTVAGFLDAYIAKIKSQCKVGLSTAKDGEVLRMGNVYFIPPLQHGKIHNGSLGPILKLEGGAPVASQIPSSTVLFKSAAESYGAGVYSILLGGFGNDGVDGLSQVQTRGGVSVVQNPEQANFPFGPQMAIQKAVADEILNTEAIAKHVMQYRNQNLY